MNLSNGEHGNSLVGVITKKCYQQISSSSFIEQNDTANTRHALAHDKSLATVLILLQ